MKKFILSLAMLALLALGANAQTFKYQSFFGSSSNVVILAGSTNSLGSTNIYSRGMIGTNSQSFTNAGWYSDAASWCNADGSAANVAAVLQFTGLNANATNLFTVNIYPLARYNPAGSVNQSGPYTPTLGSVFTFTVNGLGTSRVSIRTNIPTSVIQGAGGFRGEITSPYIGAATGTNTTWSAFGFEGFAPNNN